MTENLLHSEEKPVPNYDGPLEENSPFGANNETPNPKIPIKMIEDKPRSGCGCSSICIAVLGLSLVGSLCLNGIQALSQMGNYTSNYNHSVMVKSLDIKYELIDSDNGIYNNNSKKIVVIPIDGTIGSHEDDNIKTFANPRGLKFALEMISEDENVAAVVLKINSPGGGLTPSDIMYHELRRFKEQTKLPIYAYFEDVACSGGYYISMVADKIYACPTTMTGSIGVIMELPEISELMKKMGIKMVTIASLNSEGKPSFKDIGSMFREMKPEEKKMLQAMITESWNGFVDVVAEGRKQKLTRDEVAKLADGRIFSAKQAKKAKIIDDICYPDELYGNIREALSKNSGHDNCIVVETYLEESLMNSLGKFKLNYSLDPVGTASSLSSSASIPQRYYINPANWEKH